MRAFVLICVLISSRVFCQPCNHRCVDFEIPVCLNEIYIDTLSQNLWQIGRPKKPQFNTANTSPNVIITDTSNFYPVKKQSSFILRTRATMGDVYGFTNFEGAYNVQSDSAKDFGKMEFSPNKGVTWVDMINDTVYNVVLWYSPKPILTGNSKGWKGFYVLLAEIGSVFNLHVGDTLLYRFTFKSDSIPENMGGLMFDNFCFFEFVEGVSEIHFKPIKSNGHPNPATNHFSIDFDNRRAEPFELAIYSIQSKLLISRENIREEKVEIDTKSLTAGTYVYKLTNLKSRERAWGKFVKIE